MSVFKALFKPLMLDPQRWLIHLPVGGFTAWTGTVHWVYPLVFMLGFMAFEVTEDWRLRDGAYIDIQGYLWGLATGIVGVYLTK